MKLRIAPSPTGHLHIGNARTALFNWLYARANNGTFLVRIDDTDTARSSEEYINDIVKNFKWLGIDWDEGIQVGGPHGEYKQSLRFDRYREIAESLLSRGYAQVSDGVQVQDLLRSCGIDKDFCQANAIKYLARFGKKDGRNRKDLLKAVHYIVLLMNSEDQKGEK